MSIKDWDERHRDAPIGDPVPLVVETAARLTPGRALDLACGSGRNAIWLARNGWSVTAVDGSPVAIAMLRAEGLPITTILTDLEGGEFTIEPASWDLIVVSYYLQQDLCPAIVQGLRPGGTVIAIALLGEGRYRVAPGELPTFFPDCDVLHYRETDVAELVAQGRRAPPPAPGPRPGSP